MNFSNLEPECIKYKSVSNLTIVPELYKNLFSRCSVFSFQQRNRLVKKTSRGFPYSYETSPCFIVSCFTVIYMNDGPVHTLHIKKSFGGLMKSFNHFGGRWLNYECRTFWYEGKKYTTSVKFLTLLTQSTSTRMKPQFLSSLQWLIVFVHKNCKAGIWKSLKNQNLCCAMGMVCWAVTYRQLNSTNEGGAVLHVWSRQKSEDFISWCQNNPLVQIRDLQSVSQASLHHICSKGCENMFYGTTQQSWKPLLLVRPYESCTCEKRLSYSRPTNGCCVIKRQCFDVILDLKNPMSAYTIINFFLFFVGYVHIQFYVKNVQKLLYKDQELEFSSVVGSIRGNGFW